MSKQVTVALGNRYCQERLKAAEFNPLLKTRASAADFLPGVSEECLKKYELDINSPSSDVVMYMVDAYNSPELGAWYCANKCPLGRDRREMQDMPIERTLIRASNVVSHYDIVIDQISQIIDDGVIDEDERELLPSIREKILEVKRRNEELLGSIDKLIGSLKEN